MTIFLPENLLIRFGKALGDKNFYFFLYIILIECFVLVEHG